VETPLLDTNSSPAFVLVYGFVQPLVRIKRPLSNASCPA